MTDKNTLKTELEETQRVAEELATQIAEEEAKMPHRNCRYSPCGISFATEDGRKQYCCPEHYLIANRERTKKSNIERKKTP